MPPRGSVHGSTMPAGWTPSIKVGGVANRRRGALNSTSVVTGTHDLHGATRRGVRPDFSGAINQVAGWNNAQFITKADGILYARTVNNAARCSSHSAPAWFGAPHRFAIRWATAACSTKSTAPRSRITRRRRSARCGRCSSATCRQWAAVVRRRLDRVSPYAATGTSRRASSTPASPCSG